MHTLPSTTPRHRAIDQLRALVRLAVVALRRTAFENSAHLLAAGVALFLLADGARRVHVPSALDRWLVAAFTMAVVLPVPLAGNDPLRSQRMALLPVPRRVLGRTRVVGSAPLRLPLALVLLIEGGVPTYRAASGAAVFTLVAWAVAAFFAGAVLDEFWHRPRAIVARAIAAAMVACGAWCFWSLRGTTPWATASAPVSWIPALLPREGNAAGWLIALLALAVSVALGAVVLRAPWQQVSATATRALPAPVHSVLAWRRIQLFNATSFPRFVRPSVAHEIALLSRHVGSRVALGLVAALACAATYGRVPGLALLAMSPMISLTAIVLGADVPLGGLMRHRLQPASLTNVRDRRLTVWGVSSALVAALGASVGLLFPAPSSVGQPTGGVFGAPCLLVYAVTLIPWFGRASWWWARRYPQPLAQRVSEVGAAVVTLPAGAAHLALALFAAWAGVSLLAALLWAAAFAMVRAVAAVASSVDMPVPTMDQISWIGAALLAAVVASGAHVALSAISPRAATTRIGVRAKAIR